MPASVPPLGHFSPKHGGRCAGKLDRWILNPFKNATFDLVADVFDELADIFPDDFLHLGMDEVTRRRARVSRKETELPSAASSSTAATAIVA